MPWYVLECIMNILAEVHNLNFTLWHSQTKARRNQGFKNEVHICVYLPACEAVCAFAQCKETKWKLICEASGITKNGIQRFCVCGTEIFSMYILRSGQTQTNCSQTLDTSAWQSCFDWLITIMKWLLRSVGLSWETVPDGDCGGWAIGRMFHQHPSPIDLPAPAAVGLCVLEMMSQPLALSLPSLFLNSESHTTASSVNKDVLYQPWRNSGFACCKSPPSVLSLLLNIY